ncbi:MAG: DUF3775 domain-containing protein [Stellaceae bacterium]
MLALPLQKLAFLIEKARTYDAEVPVDPGAASGSNPTDDGSREILADTPDNPTEQELRDAIDGLNVDERRELLALLWLGCGDFDAAGWPEALRQACAVMDETETAYFLGTPLLADYLEEGAAALGLSLEAFEGP